MCRASLQGTGVLGLFDFSKKKKKLKKKKKKLTRCPSDIQGHHHPKHREARSFLCGTDITGKTSSRNPFSHRAENFKKDAAVMLQQITSWNNIRVL